MALYCAVVLLDVVVTILTIIDGFSPNMRFLIEGKPPRGEFGESPQAVFVVIAVEVANCAVYAFAAILRYQEYVRMMTEAWYAHKLFIWSNLVLHALHLAIFFPLYSPLHTMLCLVRCSILLAILVTMALTKPRTTIDRVNTDRTTAISRSRSLYLQFETQSDDKPVSSPTGSNMTDNGPYYSRQFSKVTHR